MRLKVHRCTLRTDRDCFARKVLNEGFLLRSIQGNIAAFDGIDAGKGFIGINSGWAVGIHKDTGADKDFAQHLCRNRYVSAEGIKGAVGAEFEPHCRLAILLKPTKHNIKVFGVEYRHKHKKDTIFIVSFFLSFVSEKELGEKLIFPSLIIQTRRALPKLFRLSYLLTVPKNRARLF